MRFQQKQRKINKTERQRYERRCSDEKTRQRRCLLDNIKKFKEDHTVFVNKDMDNYHIDFDNTLDWKVFLATQNERFESMMKKQRVKNWKKIKETTIWKNMINSFAAAAKLSSAVSSNNRYQSALMVLDNIK